MGLTPRPGGRQLGQARERQQPLGHLGLGGEEPLPAQSHPLDQPPHEDVGTPLLQRRRRGAVELQEGLDPLPRLGLDLGAVERRLAGGDHVQLAPPCDRRQPRQVARAQLDRRPCQRPGRGRRVVGVGEHPQPGDRVAHLGPLEEGGRTGEVERDAPLLHRRRDRATPLRRVVDRGRRSPPAACRRRPGARPPAPPPAPAPARCAHRQKRTSGSRNCCSRTIIRPRGVEASWNQSLTRGRAPGPSASSSRRKDGLGSPRPAPTGSRVGLGSCPRVRRPSRS